MQPIVTFKAGLCDIQGNNKIKCLPTPGFIFLYIGEEDDLTHFCWTPQASTEAQPEMDLLMFPGDCSFTPLVDPKNSTKDVLSPTTGRIFKLKFTSSADRHFFWLQSKPTHSSGKPNAFSEKDLKLGEIVNQILSGDDVDVQSELNQIDGAGRPDDDEEMGDAPPEDHELRRTSTGGAGADATGGDVREEGHSAREGGADGGRAEGAFDASAAVQNFLRSLGGASGGGAASQSHDGPFTTLSDLMTPDACIASLNDAPISYLDTLLSNLPSQLLLLAQEADDLSVVEMDSSTTEAAIAALSVGQKKNLLTRVFRSPQLHQSLGSLTMAIRDGGLPMVAESLKIKVENGGMIRHGNVPLGEGKAVEAFLEGVKNTVKEEKDDKPDGGSMDTS